MLMIAAHPSLVPRHQDSHPGAVFTRAKKIELSSDFELERHPAPEICQIALSNSLHWK
jgi:hypothetical protein